MSEQSVHGKRTRTFSVSSASVVSSPDVPTHTKVRSSQQLSLTLPKFVLHIIYQIAPPTIGSGPEWRDLWLKQSDVCCTAVDWALCVL